MAADIEDPPFCFRSSSCSWRHLHGHSLKETETRRSDRKTFQTEHITQDIVCKLSVHEMEMLGINSRSDMMFQIEFTLIAASRVIRARWREIQRFVLEFK